MKTNKKNVGGLIRGCRQLEAKTIEELVFLGKATIRETLRSWRACSYCLSDDIKKADKRIQWLTSLTASSIRENAEQYENPEFPEVGIFKGGCWETEEVEPLDARSINRDYRTTTFNVCGWCKYAQGSQSHSNCVLKPYCGILSDVGVSEKYEFNTPCFLKEATTEKIEEIKKGYEEKLQRLIKEKRASDRKIKFLLTLERRAETKPTMPKLRPLELFAINDEVVCYLSNLKGLIIPDPFVTGTVINGYRHGDGTESIFLSKRAFDSDYLDGCAAFFGISRPEIMLKWEFEYLVSHLDFAKYWLEKGTSNDLEGLNKENFLKALESESLTRSKE